jgi:uncharacterized repeat protein (TIGR01451 family)
VHLVITLLVIPSFLSGGLTRPAELNRGARASQSEPIELIKLVSESEALPGTELAYQMTYVNVGGILVRNLVVVDEIPASTQFKVGSATIGEPPFSIHSIVAQYSNDGGSSWTYTPVSGGGGAPPSFDATVTHVRFVLLGTLPPGVAPRVGVGFKVRIN